MDTNKKKTLIIFIIIAACMVAFLFWPEKQERDPSSDTETVEIEQTTELIEAEKEETADLEEEAKAEELNKAKTFWMWKGEESGEQSVEYLTLQGDGIYILRIELDEHEPQDESGKFQIKGNTITIVRNGKWIKGEIKGKSLILDGKAYRKIENVHV